MALGEADNTDTRVDAALEVGTGAVEAVPLGKLGHANAVRFGNTSARVAIADKVELVGVASDARLRVLRRLDTVAGHCSCGWQDSRCAADNANAGVRVKLNVGASAIKTILGHKVSSADVVLLGDRGARVTVLN